MKNVYKTLCYTKYVKISKDFVNSTTPEHFNDLYPTTRQSPVEFLINLHYSTTVTMWRFTLCNFEWFLGTVGNNISQIFEFKVDLTH